MNTEHFGEILSRRRQDLPRVSDEKNSSRINPPDRTNRPKYDPSGVEGELTVRLVALADSCRLLRITNVPEQSTPARPDAGVSSLPNTFTRW
jgi:hypothetical protein